MQWTCNEERRISKHERSVSWLLSGLTRASPPWVCSHIVAQKACRCCLCIKSGLNGGPVSLHLLHYTTNTTRLMNIQWMTRWVEVESSYFDTVISMNSHPLYSWTWLKKLPFITVLDTMRIKGHMLKRRLFWPCHVTLEENFIGDKLVFKKVFLFVSFTSQIPLKQVLVFKLTLEMILLLGLINSIAWISSF